MSNDCLVVRQPLRARFALFRSPIPSWTSWGDKRRTSSGLRRSDPYSVPSPFRTGFLWGSMPFVSAAALGMGGWVFLKEFRSSCGNDSPLWGVVGAGISSYFPLPRVSLVDSNLIDSESRRIRENTRASHYHIILPSFRVN